MLSLTTPGIQPETDAAAAIVKAKRSNDMVAEILSTYPDRFAAFAALPTQDRTPPWPN
jgi:2,3-dihydroxybenzoate decarboxylase